MSYITPQQAAHQLLITAPTFTDTCVRLAFTAGSGDYGYGKPTYPAGASFACLFVEEPVLDAQGETQVPMADGKLYYAIGTTLNSADRVQITHMLGRAVATPKTYEISKGPSEKHNVMEAELRLVTDS